MAVRFWVGGANTWDATVGTKWATSSGGAGGASVPTAADDVFFSNLSTGNCTLSSSSVCRSINCTGFTGTITHPAAVTFNIGDATAGASNVALLFVSGMTYTLGSTTTSAISFVSTSTTQQTITTGGKTMAAFVLNGIGGSWILGSSLTMTQVANATLTLTNGSFDTGSFNYTGAGFFSNNTNVRTVLLGSSTFNLASNAGGGWVVNSTNLSFNSGTSTIISNTSNTGVTFGNGLVFYNFTIIYGNGSGAITGPAIINNNLTMQGGGTARFIMASDLVCNGTLNITGSSTVNTPIMFSNIAGTQRTIYTSPTSPVSISNCHFQDIRIPNPSGASYPSTYTGDAGGNSGIAFSPARILYFVNNGTTSYSATASWSLTSGGAGGQNPPMPQDQAIFDANSITSAGRTLQINWQGCPDIDLSNVLNNPIISMTNTNGFITFMGDFKVKAGMTFTGTTGYSFRGRKDCYLDLKGITSASPLRGLDMLPGKKVILLSDYLSTGVTATQIDTAGALTSGAQVGEFDANGFNVTAPFFQSTSSNNRIITMGSGTWRVTGTGNVWNITTGTNLTLNRGTSTIVISDTSATQKTFIGNAKTYYNLNVTGDNVVIQNNNTFNTIFNNTAGLTNGLKLTSGSNNTISDFKTNGSLGSLSVLASTTAGSAATLTKVGGAVVVNYMSIKDSTATGGATFYAGSGSTNVSGNTGWIFQDGRRITGVQSITGIQSITL